MLYFYNEDGWWVRGDAGTLWHMEDGRSFAYAAEKSIFEQMEAGTYPFRVDDATGC